MTEGVVLRSRPVTLAWLECIDVVSLVWAGDAAGRPGLVIWELEAGTCLESLWVKNTLKMGVGEVVDGSSSPRTCSGLYIWKNGGRSWPSCGRFFASVKEAVFERFN